LEEANYIVDSKSKFDKDDAYLYKTGWNNNLDFIGDFKIETKLDEIVQIGINQSKKLYEEKDIYYNKINTEAWVNIVRSKNPVQENFKYGDKYHTHTKIQKKLGRFFPHYTYVYYIQMPNVMNEEDGVLYFLGENKKEYWIRPEEDDLIIMQGDVPHAPNNAPNSTIDRIVIAGNVGFDLIKKNKTIM
jgi:hypothetical protein